MSYAHILGNSLYFARFIRVDYVYQIIGESTMFMIMTWVLVSCRLIQFGSRGVLQELGREVSVSYINFWKTE